MDPICIMYVFFVFETGWNPVLNSILQCCARIKKEGSELVFIRIRKIFTKWVTVHFLLVCAWRDLLNYKKEYWDIPFPLDAKVLA